MFGHEIVAILCGVVWGLWIGFAIVAAGTLLGELGNFYAFRYLLTKKGEKLERTSLKYAALAKLIRRGGYLVRNLNSYCVCQNLISILIKIPTVVRFSAIPGHCESGSQQLCRSVLD